MEEREKIYTPFKKKSTYILTGLLSTLILMALGIRYFTSNIEVANSIQIELTKLNRIVTNINYKVKENQKISFEDINKLKSSYSRIWKSKFLQEKSIVGLSFKDKNIHLKKMLEAYQKEKKKITKQALIGFIEGDFLNPIYDIREGLDRYSKKMTQFLNYFIVFCFFSSMFLTLIFVPIVYKPLLKSLNDIVESLKINEKKLIESQKIAEVGTWEYSKKQAEFYLSDQFMNLIDLEFDEKISYESFYEMIIEDQKEIFEEAFFNTLNNGVNLDVELSLITKGDRMIWIRLIGKVIKQDNVVKTVYGTGQDITDKKSAENRFEKLFNQSNEAYVLYDEAGVIDCNIKAIEMIGFNDKFDMIRTHQATFSPLNQPDGRTSIEKEREMFNLAKEKGKCDYQWTLRKVSGENLSVDVHLTSIDSGGKKLIIAQWREVKERIEFEKKTRALRLKTQNIITNKIDFIIEAIQKLYHPAKEIQTIINSHGELDKEIFKYSLNKFTEEFDLSVLGNIDRSQLPSFSFNLFNVLNDFVDNLSLDFKIEKNSSISKYRRRTLFGGYINFKKSLNLIHEYLKIHVSSFSTFNFEVDHKEVDKKFYKLDMKISLQKSHINEYEQFLTKLERLTKYDMESSIEEVEEQLFVTLSYVFESDINYTVENFEYIVKGVDYNIKLLHYGNSKEWTGLSKFFIESPVEIIHANSISELQQKLELDYFDMILFSSRDANESQQLENILMHFKESSYIGRIFKNDLTQKGKVEDFKLIHPISKSEVYYYITQYINFREGNKSTRMLKQEARKSFKNFVAKNNDKFSHIDDVLNDLRSYIPKVIENIQTALDDSDFHLVEKRSRELLAVIENFEYISLNEKLRLLIRLSQLEENKLSKGLFKQVSVEISYFMSNFKNAPITIAS